MFNRINQFLDYLFPTYNLVWDFMVGPTHLKGSMPFDSKGATKRAARDMNKMYGYESHWVTDKDGNIV